MQRCPCIKSNPILHWANAIRGTALLRQLDNELWREFTLACSAQIAHDWRSWTAIQVIREYEDSQGKKVSLRKQKCTVRVIQLHSSTQANESIVCAVGNCVYCQSDGEENNCQKCTDLLLPDQRVTTTDSTAEQGKAVINDVPEVRASCRGQMP